MMASLFRLSPREQRLFIITALVVGASVLFMGVKKTQNYLSDLDTQIEDAERDYLALLHLNARKTSIEEHFRRIEAHHSSSWTLEEIHDRLGREIYRLAKVKPPVVAGEVSPAPWQGSAVGDLIRIPSLSGGSLNEEQGYREYHMTVRIPDTDLPRLLVFLQRLEESPQSLRIDRLEFGRAGADDSVNAAIEITRTIVDGNPSGEINSVPMVMLQNGGMEEWLPNNGGPVAWQHEGCNLKKAFNLGWTEGAYALEATASQDRAMIWQEFEMAAGQTYQLTMDLTSTAEAKIQVVDKKTNEPYADTVTVRGNSTPMTYRLRFRVPGKFGDGVDIIAPRFILLETGAKLIVDEVRLDIVDSLN